MTAAGRRAAGLPRVGERVYDTAERAEAIVTDIRVAEGATVLVLRPVDGPMSETWEVTRRRVRPIGGRPGTAGARTW